MYVEEEYLLQYECKLTPPGPASASRITKELFGAIEHRYVIGRTRYGTGAQDTVPKKQQSSVWNPGCVTNAGLIVLAAVDIVLRGARNAWISVPESVYRELEGGTVVRLPRHNSTATAAGVPRSTWLWWDGRRLRTACWRSGIRLRLADSSVLHIVRKFYTTGSIARRKLCSIGWMNTIYSPLSGIAVRLTGR